MKISAISAEWKLLNDQLRHADEATCERLLKKELRGQQRLTYLLRIHSRLNRVRAARERRELI